MGEKKNEIFVSTLKGLIGAIPTIGTALNEAIFEHRARVKQKRVNEFVEDFGAYMKDRSVKQANLEQISSDQFGDIFEAIIREVAETSSVEKKNRFKLILANQLLHPIKTDFVEVYIDVIAKLNDTQINILAAHFAYQGELKRKIEKRARLTTMVEELKIIRNDKLSSGTLKGAGKIKLDREIATAEYELTHFDKSFELKKDHQKHECYNISEGEFFYYKQDLAAKGLLEQVKFASVHEYHVMTVTNFAKGLLQFIKEDNTE